MFHIRCTKTKSNATAIQVVRYVFRKTIVLKHIGSTHNPEEIPLLKTAATDWIKQNNPQESLFQSEKDSQSHPQTSQVLLSNQLKLISTHSIFIYEILFKIIEIIGFTSLLKNHPKRQLLLDLVITRLIHPASKLNSLQFLEEEFGIIYKKTNVYREISDWIDLKDKVEKIVVNFAKEQLNFNFKVVFYDVTTLYFESFKSDEELKQCGFSKDNKFNQPQIVIGLIVNNQGFPISYEVFPGNKFEGHTFISILEDLKKKHNIKTLTVVADAAMISQKNVDALLDKKLNYIVGARTGNLKQNTISNISHTLNKQDQASIRITTTRGNLICGFSKKRYQKDKHETNKQITKAENAVKNPQKGIKRLKFITNAKTNPKINTKLIKKTKMLWGIKGYYTNLKKISNEEIIHQYQQLWKVEKSFRITKSDLQARPIYHRNTDTIKSHILICFMALSIAKYLEIKSDLSVKKALKLLRSVKDAKIQNKLTNEIITMRSDPSKDVENLLEILDFNLSY